MNMFEKRLCFKAMREDFLDSYCDQGANHACCRNASEYYYIQYVHLLYCNYHWLIIWVQCLKDIPVLKKRWTRV